MVEPELRNSLRRYPAKHTRWLTTCILTVFGLVLALGTFPYAYAATFGSGPYGTCAYQSGCASTVVTLPASTSATSAPATTTPLEININLTNNQVIPRSGYTVLATPLNGRGASFQQAQFYVNGTLVQTQTPDADGTASWFWNVGQYPGTNIKVVVTGTDGQTVTRVFQVTLGAVAAQNSNMPTTQPSVIQQIISTPKKAVQSISHSIDRLPPSVKYGLPYVLFLLLGGDILLLLFRTRHEIAESKRLQELLTRERQNGELKRMFTELVSHYLRTPITIISGGLELSVHQQDLTSVTLKSAQNCVTQLNVATDELLAQLTDKDAALVSDAAQQIVVAKPLWRQFSLYAPIALIGFVAFCFDYLARHSKGFSVGQGNVIIQIVLFGSLCFLIYQLLRHRQLRHRDQVETSRILNAETTFNSERDEVIAYSATKIKQLVDELAAQVVQLQQPQAKKLATEGVGRLQDVVGKLMIANQLRGSTITKPYVWVELDKIVATALLGLEDQYTVKAVHIKTLHNTKFQTQSEPLLVVVLHTILDNAIAYSEQNDEIAIDADLQRTTVAITVTDHGVGIPADKKFSLFQAFSKTEGAETFNHEGMGFSLYLDKLIMNYLVGDITIESEPKQGTKVTLTLPQPINSR